MIAVGMIAVGGVVMIVVVVVIVMIVTVADDFVEGERLRRIVPLQVAHALGRSFGRRHHHGPPVGDPACGRWWRRCGGSGDGRRWSGRRRLGLDLGECRGIGIHVVHIIHSSILTENRSTGETPGQLSAPNRLGLFSNQGFEGGKLGLLGGKGSLFGESGSCFGFGLGIFEVLEGSLAGQEGLRQLAALGLEQGPSIHSRRRRSCGSRSGGGEDRGRRRRRLG